MVDFADIARVNLFTIELRQIDAAIANFDAGGAIISMMVSGGPVAEGVTPERLPATVTTAYMQYPPQMITAIKTMLAARRDEVVKELQDLGVTGDKDTSDGMGSPINPDEIRG